MGIQVCPVLSNNKAREEFADMQREYGSIVAYTLWSMNNGHHIKYDYDGTPNEYYNKMIEQIEKETDADKKKDLRRELYSKRLNYINYHSPQKREFIDSRIANHILPALQLRGNEQVHVLSNDDIDALVSENQANAIYTFSRNKKSHQVISIFKDGEIYINKDVVKGRQKTYLYEYTHLWIHTLKNTNKNFKVDWQQIKKYFKSEVQSLTDKDKSDYTVENDIIAKLYNKAIKTFGYEGTLSDDQWDNVAGEMIALYTTDKMFKTLRTYKYSTFKKYINDIKTVCERFWNYVKELFVQSKYEQSEYHIESLDQIAHMVLDDLVMDIQTIHPTLTTKDKLSDEEMERIESDVQDIRTETINNLQQNNFFESAESQQNEETFKKNNSKLYAKLKLRDQFDENSSLSNAEKIDMVHIFEDSVFNLLSTITSNSDVAFMLFDNGVEHVLSDTTRERIRQEVSKNNFNPFKKIVDAMGIDNFKTLVVNQVNKTISSAVKDEQRRLEIIEDVKRFEDIWFSELNSYAKSTLDFKFKHEFQIKDSKPEDQNSTIQSDDDSIEDDIEKIVQSHLQVSQTNVNLYKATDKTVLFWLSGITSNVTDQFGRKMTYRPKQVFDMLVSLFYDVDNIDEFINRLSNSRLEYSKILLSRIEKNTILKQKLVSSIQKAYNQYIELKTSETGVELNDLNKPEETAQSITSTAFMGQIADSKQTDESGTLFYRESDTDALQLNVVKLQSIQTKFENAYNQFFNALDQAGIEKRRNQYYTNDTQQIQAFDQAAKIFAVQLKLALDDMGLTALSASTIETYLCKKYENGQVAYARHTTWLNQLGKLNQIATLMQKDINDTNKTNKDKVGSILKKYRHAFHILYKLEPHVNKMSIHNAGKSYSVFSPINFVQRFVNAVKHKTGTAFANLKSKFDNSYFHQSAMSDNKSEVLSWLDAVLNKDTDVQLSTITTFDDQQYKEFNSLYYLLYSLVNFENGRYILPILSDKSTHYSIRLMRVNTENQENEFILNSDKAQQIHPKLIDKFETVFYQELTRMRHVYELRNDGGKVSIKNMHTDIKDNEIPIVKDAFRFTFLPQFNQYLRMLNDNNLRGTDKLIVDSIREYITTGVITNPLDFNKVIDAQIEQSLLDRARTYRTQLTGILNFLNQCGLAENTQVQQLQKYVGNELNFNNWYVNCTYANTQMQQMWTGDEIYYKSATETQKRNAEYVSPGTKQNIPVDSKYRSIHNAKKSFVVLKDNEVSAQNLACVLDNGSKSQNGNLFDTLKRVFDKAKNEKLKHISDLNKKDELSKKLDANYQAKLNKYNKIDSTDGQGLISLDYVGRLLESLGRDTEFKKVYNIITSLLNKYNRSMSYEERKKLADEARKRLNPKTIKQVMETVKQFTYTTSLRNKNELTPLQVKNAEYPMLDIISMLESKDDTLIRLMDWMYKNKIDAIYFESNVKVGKGNNIAYKKLSEYTTTDELINEMQANYNSDATNQFANSKYVTQVGIDEVVLQQETPSHYLDHHIRLGNQIIKLITNCLVENENDIVSELGITKKQLRNKFYDLLGKKVSFEVNKAIKERFGIDNVEDFEKIFADLDNPKNIQYKERLSEWLANQVNSDDDTNLDLLKAVTINPATADFNLTPNNPLCMAFIEKMITSVIKQTICELRMPGAQLVQVTDNVRIAKSINTDDSLKIVFNTDANGNPKSIKYVECELPLYSQKLIDKYIDNNGQIDMDAIEKENPKLLELVCYRIPTEGYCSMLPLKVKRFSSNITGGIIKLPTEAPVIMGIDFDIDKLFTIMPELDSNGIVIKDNDTDLAGVNNSILHTMRNILTTETALNYQLTPSGYINVTKASQQNAVYVAKLNELQEERTHAFAMDVAFDDAENATSSEITDQEKLNLYNEVHNYDDTRLGAEFDKLDLDTDINDVATQAGIHNRNFSGKKLLGIIAATITQHSLSRTWNILVENLTPFTLNNVTINKTHPLDVVYSSDDITTVIENFSEFLAAAPDTAKDPTFYNLNVGIGTINMLIPMMRMGFDIETIVLFLQQPIVIKMNQIINYSPELSRNAIIDAMNKFFSQFKDLTTPENPNISKNNLITSIGSDEFTQENINFVNQQYQIYQIAKQFLNISEKAFDVGSIVNLNNASSLSLNGDVFRMITSQDNIKTIINTKNSKSNALKLSDNLAYVLDKSSESASETNQNYNAFLSSVFNNRERMLQSLLKGMLPLLYYFSTNYNTSANDRNIRFDYNNWLTYVLFNLKTQDGDYILSHDQNLRNYYEKVFPYKIAQLKQQLLNTNLYKNNLFLQKLSCKGEYSLEIGLDSYGLRSADIKYLTDGWEQLLMNDNPQIKKAFQELYIYELYHNGFNFVSNTLTKIAPTRLMKQLGTINSFFKYVSDLAQTNHPDLKQVTKEFFALKKQLSSTEPKKSHQWYNENITDKNVFNSDAEESDIDTLAESLTPITINPLAFFVSSLNLTESQMSQIDKEVSNNIIKLC